MENFKFNGMTIVARPEVNASGYTILAFFNCTVNGFEMVGCAFVRTPRQGLTVWPPKVHGRAAMRQHVTIVDDQLRQALVRHAQAAYRALGGIDGEWRDVDDEIEGNAVGLQRFMAGAV